MKSIVGNSLQLPKSKSNGVIYKGSRSDLSKTYIRSELDVTITLSQESIILTVRYLVTEA